MQHPDEGTIHAWLDDALPGDERAELERHVASCAECSALVAEARGMIAGASRIVGALDAVPGGVIPKPKPAPVQSLSLWRLLRITPTRAAIAAALLVAASALVTKRHDTPDKMIPHAPPVAAAHLTSPQRAPVSVVQAPPAGITAAAPAIVPELKQAPQKVAGAPSPATPPTAPAADVAAVAAVAAIASDAGVKATAVSTSDGRRNFSARSEMRNVTGIAADVAANEFAGCYQILLDSAPQPSQFPERFALQTATPNGAEPHGTVHAVTPAGRVDSVLAGSSWSVITPTVASVSFASVDGPQRMTLLFVRTTGVSTMMATGAERQRIAISHPKCLP
jgi:hypothetical protein